jgi:hypothetical protein
MEQVAHRAYEDSAGIAPVKGFVKAFSVQIINVAIPFAFSGRNMCIPLFAHKGQTVSHSLGVAILAAGRTFRASGNRVPAFICPFDFSSHTYCSFPASGFKLAHKVDNVTQAICGKHAQRRISLKDVLPPLRIVNDLAQRPTRLVIETAVSRPLVVETSRVLKMYVLVPRFHLRSFHQ